MGIQGLKHTSYKKALKYLTSKDFGIKQGSQHTIAIKDDVVISLPRHNKISIGVTTKIAHQLIRECGFTESEVIKALKK